MKLTALVFSLLSLVSTCAEAETNRTWEKQIVAACLVLEAANQGEMGMRAVASVIRNRANGNPEAILRVVKRPYAFSAFNSVTTKNSGVVFEDLIRRASHDRVWPLAQKIVEELYAPQWQDITGGADHYARYDANPNWARSMNITAIIGEHRFYAALR